MLMVGHRSDWLLELLSGHQILGARLLGPRRFVDCRICLGSHGKAPIIPRARRRRIPAVVDELE